jgi:hypothetical protein
VEAGDVTVRIVLGDHLRRLDGEAGGADGGEGGFVADAAEVLGTPIQSSTMSPGIRGALVSSRPPGRSQVAIAVKSGACVCGGRWPRA